MLLNKVQIGRNAGLDRIESEMASMEHEAGPLELTLSIDERGVFFREQWLGMATAAALVLDSPPTIVPWGHQDAPDLDDDDNYVFSLAMLLGLQRGALVTTDGPEKMQVVADEVRRQVWERRGGVLGSGGRLRRVVEFDPESPLAPALRGGTRPDEVFRDQMRGWLRDLEIGARSRGGSGELGAKGALLDFLFELRANGLEHAGRTRGVRMLRLQKHLAPNRAGLLTKAGSFGELADYIRSQPATGPVNLVEASVSDFGPGILRSFLSSFSGRAHCNRPAEDVLHDLIHTQLSAKSDPGAGLGIPNALTSAKRMFGFVSLRTGRHWLVMDGTRDIPAMMTPRAGPHPHVEGTHWQLIYPDLTLGSTPPPRRAPV